MLGFVLGIEDGSADGRSLGIFVGVLDGIALRLGWSDGLMLGASLGK